MTAPYFSFVQYKWKPNWKNSKMHFMREFNENLHNYSSCSIIMKINELIWLSCYMSNNIYLVYRQFVFFFAFWNFVNWCAIAVPIEHIIIIYIYLILVIFIHNSHSKFIKRCLNAENNKWHKFAEKKMYIKNSVLS